MSSNKSSMKIILMKKPYTISTHLDSLLLAVQLVMLGLLAVKSLLILMVDGAATEVEHLVAKMEPKLIEVLLMLLDGLPKVWYLVVFVKEHWLKLPMELVYLIQLVFLLILMELLLKGSLTIIYLKSFLKTLI